MNTRRIRLLLGVLGIALAIVIPYFNSKRDVRLEAGKRNLTSFANGGTTPKNAGNESHFENKFSDAGGSSKMLPDESRNDTATETAPAASVRVEAAPTGVTTDVPTNIPLPKFVGGHRANVPPGGALVTGGWPQPNGNRLLMFSSPMPVPGGAEDQIMVSSQFIALPPSRLAGGGWGNFLKDDAVSTEGGVYSAAEYSAMMKAIGGFKEVDLLSAPTITTRYGQMATIEIMAERIEKVGDKSELKRDGLSQGIIARKIEGSTDVDLAVSAAQYESGTKTP